MHKTICAKQMHLASCKISDDVRFIASHKRQNTNHLCGVHNPWDEVPVARRNSSQNSSALQATWRRTVCGLAHTMPTKNPRMQ